MVFWAIKKGFKGWTSSGPAFQVSLGRYRRALAESTKAKEDHIPRGFRYFTFTMKELGHSQRVQILHYGGTKSKQHYVIYVFIHIYIYILIMVFKLGIWTLLDKHENRYPHHTHDGCFWEHATTLPSLVSKASM